MRSSRVMRDDGRLGFGVSVEGGPLASADLRALSDAVGEKPTIVLWFEDFHAPPPSAGVAAMGDFDAMPIITWEPWHATLESIAFGEHDAHLGAWAEALASSGSQVGLRFAHEFNGLAMAHRVLDELSYRRDDQGNHWTLVRKRTMDE